MSGSAVRVSSGGRLAIRIFICVDHARPRRRRKSDLRPTSLPFSFLVVDGFGHFQVDSESTYVVIVPQEGEDFVSYWPSTEFVSFQQAKYLIYEPKVVARIALPEEVRDCELAQMGFSQGLDAWRYRSVRPPVLSEVTDAA